MKRNAPSGEYAAGDLSVTPYASVWHMGREVLPDLAIVSGNFVQTTTDPVPDRLDIVVPRVVDGVDFLPTKSRLIGSDGHRIHAGLHIANPYGTETWDVPLGQFQVHQWDSSDNEISLGCNGLLQMVVDHLAAKPRGTVTASPMKGEIMKLLGDDGLIPWFHPDLPNRSLPRGFTFGENRMESVEELASAWPARIRMGADGRVLFLPPLLEEPMPVTTLTDGERGTIISAPLSGTREGYFNHVIVRAQDTEAQGQPGLVEEAFITTGKHSVHTYGWVSTVVESDAITTRAQAQSVARAELRKYQTQAKTVSVEMAPDYRLELDDAVEVVTADARYWGYITGIDHSLTADADSRIDVGVVE